MSELLILKYLKPKKLAKSKLFYFKLGLALLLFMAADNQVLVEESKANVREIHNFLKNAIFNVEDSEIKSFSKEILESVKNLDINLAIEIFEHFKDLKDNFCSYDFKEISFNADILSNVMHGFLSNVLNDKLNFEEIAEFIRK